MARVATWRGHDYVLHEDVELPRSVWKERIAKAVRTVRAGGDLLLFEGTPSGHRIVAEIYDRNHAS